MLRRILQSSSHSTVSNPTIKNNPRSFFSKPCLHEQQHKIKDAIAEFNKQNSFNKLKDLLPSLLHDNLKKAIDGLSADEMHVPSIRYVNAIHQANNYLFDRLGESPIKQLHEAQPDSYKIVCFTSEFFGKDVGDSKQKITQDTETLEFFFKQIADNSMVSLMLKLSHSRPDGLNFKQRAILESTLTNLSKTSKPEDFSEQDFDAKKQYAMNFLQTMLSSLSEYNMAKNHLR